MIDTGVTLEGAQTMDSSNIKRRAAVIIQASAFVLRFHGPPAA